jgi:CspA family cold shock protein
MKGNVKFFNDVKGFGFIKGEDEKEYFVHQSGLKDKTWIRENDSVVFDIEEGEKGQKAVNVELAEKVEKSSESEEVEEDENSEEDSEEIEE